jgi:hypothetical protein
MSYDVSSGAIPPEQRPLPGSVRAAGTLLYAAAGLLLVQVIINASIINRQLKATKEAFTGLDNGQTVITITRVTTVASLIVQVLIAAVFIIFAIYNLRGRQGIRIATWVVGGLAVLCFGCGALGGSVGTRFSNAGTNQDPQIKAATQHVADSIPDWASTLGVVISVLLFLCLAGVIILLAVPASNAYFRKPEPPAMPYPSYPPVG